MNTDKACDFCSAKPVVARHQLDARNVAPWEDQPARWWYVCAECQVDVLGQNEGAIAHRAIERIPWLASKSEEIAWNEACALTDRFWSLDAGIWERIGFE